jgi:ketosteroid isomerase-like protein
MTPPNLTQPPPPFSVDQFARFWAAPDVALVAPAMFAEDVVGDWPGDPEPVRGFASYRARIGQLLDAVPDLTLEVAEHATNGNLIFIRWIARGTGAGGPFELTGMDRIRTEDGRVKENIIRYDTAAMEAAIGARRAAA